MMSNAKHTPGPWFLRGTETNASVRVCHGMPSRTICNIRARPKDIDDARLIAAAPELLAALERICNPPKDCDPAKWAEDWAFARAAIAKATNN